MKLSFVCLLNATPYKDNVEELSTDSNFAIAFIFLRLYSSKATNAIMNATVH